MTAQTRRPWIRQCGERVMIPLPKLSLNSGMHNRREGVETHVAEPTKKNDFLSDLQKLDTGKMETKVRDVATHNVMY